MTSTEIPLHVTAVAGGMAHDADPRPRAEWPVVLVSMPFMDLGWPSIQLGLLAAILRERGYPVRTLHANLDFAARLGAGYYRLLAERKTRMVADWLFSLEAFGAAAPDRDARLLDDFESELADLSEAGPDWRQRLLRVRHDDVPAYLDALASDPLWEGVRVVGFTSTFQQNTASFALARRLKRVNPELVTLFGGANFDGEMGPEWVRSVDCVDLAVVGEADTALPRLLDSLVSGAGPSGVPGVVHRVGERVVVNPPAPPLRRMDDLPLPDYSEYFERAERLDLLPVAGPSRVRIPFESARGCWWGAKHHCTFCGLNGSTMQFRAKSPQRVATELVEQARRYRSFRLHGVDNILDMSYLTELFPALAEAGITYEIFYEVKANLTRAQIRTLAQGGVTHIQPGIESLSSPVLRLMRKGVRAAQNVNLMRWATYHGIAVGWNVIWGFPGETEHDYTEQAAVFPHLVHLPPPAVLFLADQAAGAQLRVRLPGPRRPRSGGLLLRVRPSRRPAGQRLRGHPEGGGGVDRGVVWVAPPSADVLVIARAGADLRRASRGRRGDLHLRGRARRPVLGVQRPPDRRRGRTRTTERAAVDRADPRGVRRVPAARTHVPRPVPGGCAGDTRRPAAMSGATNCRSLRADPR
jgi:ribosomal peptide maturation radical SAM protein 1